MQFLWNIVSKSTLLNGAIAAKLPVQLLVRLVRFSQDNILKSPEDSENVSYEKKIGSTGDYEMLPRVFVLINVGRWIDKCVLDAFSPNFCPLPFSFFFSDYYSYTFPPTSFSPEICDMEWRRERKNKKVFSFLLFIKHTQEKILLTVQIGTM